MSLLRWPLKHRHVAVVMSLIILGLGVHSLLTMPRQDTPKIQIHQALVMTWFPGATAAQVEQQLTRPIESYLFTFTEINPKKTHSVTRDGLVVITVELQEWVPDKEAFWSRLRLGLAELKQKSLPSESIGPLVNSDFGESVALLIGVTSPKRTYAELRRYLERIEDGLRTVDGAGRLVRYGEREETIYVEADSQRLSRYRVGLSQVVQALRLQNATPYSGTLKTGDLAVPLHTRGRYSSLEEVKQQVVYANPLNEQVVRIGDVARVERRLADADSLLRINGQDAPVLLLSLEMQPGRNIVAFGKDVQAKLAELRALLPADLSLHVINDQPGVVATAVNHFIREFFVAVAAVVLVTMLLLPLRVAAIAAMAIPVTIAFTFKALEVLGIPLHEVSLASLIVVLGMVVDDAIVIADNYVEKLDEGLDHWDAAWKSAGELAVPVFTATIAIVLAFAPLAFFLTGSVGEFIRALPITVAIALVASFVVAMLFTPLLCYTFIRQGLKAQGRSIGASVLDFVQRRYTAMIHPIVRHPWLAIAAGVASLAAGAVLLLAVRQKFFPAAERAQFVIEIDQPLGTRLEATDGVVRKVETLLQGDSRITGFAAFVGTAAPRVYYSFAPEFPRSSYGMLLVNTHSDKETDEAVRDYARKFAGISATARVNVMSFQQGIPVEAPVEVRIVGPELETLRRLGDEVRRVFLRAPGATQVRDDLLDTFALDLRVNNEVANRAGLATSVIASQVMTGFTGLPVTQLWEHDAPVPIVLRLDPAHRETFSGLDEFMLRSPVTQGAIAFNQVADVEPVWSVGQIPRRAGVRTLTVRANPATDVLPSQVLAPIREELGKIKLPPGYRFEIGGEFEGQEETFTKMVGALIASVVMIYLVLLFQFKSSRETGLVMLAIPLTFFGAMLGLVMTGNPLGFTASVGLISLVGIVIRNSIILVDFADELRRHHPMDAATAAIRAGERRMRPIFLTSMAAAVGVLPMIIARSPLWAPLASVFSVGILWSMVMTLLVIPAVYGLTTKRFVPPMAKQEAHP
ncbi:AcrB/AcrD/AcrF family protein [Opitutaceae bacterium EW11]|nr:AcrB/AcrD/AcrF family protein [Opitutaceae bacterium EW11]